MIIPKMKRNELNEKSDLQFHPFISCISFLMALTMHIMGVEFGDNGDNDVTNQPLHSARSHQSSFNKAYLLPQKQIKKTSKAF